MPNTFIKAGQITDAAQLLLRRELVLARFITRLNANDFVGSLNDTVTLRVPAVIAARTRGIRSGTALVADTLAETSVPVQLDTHIYTLLNIGDDELTLDIADFARQVLQPQMRSVAEAIDSAVATELAGTVPTQSAVSIPLNGKVFDSLVDAQKLLSNANVPRGNRIAIVGPDVEARIVKEIGARETSMGDSAVSDATVARMAGLTIVGSNAVPANTAYVFHATAFAGAFISPALPDGATMKARVATEGFALRYIRDYNPTGTSGPVDRSLVDTFMGVSSINDGAGATNQRLIKLTLAAS